MKPLKYALIEHTADIGISVRGKTLKELFVNAGLAMFDLIAKREKAGGAGSSLKIKIEQKAQNLDELFVNWLNELLSLSSAKERILSGLKINSISENRLQATAAGDKTANYKVNTEIKAATYHGLELKKVSSGWQAKVIFDV